MMEVIGLGMWAVCVALIWVGIIREDERTVMGGLVFYVVGAATLCAS